MYTIRNFVSEVRGMNKLLSSEQLINDRVIAAEGRSTANLIVGQILAKRKLWNSPNLFAFIPCFKMEQVPLAECCEYTSDKKIAKSVKKLPKIGEGFYGLAIQGVFGLDNMKKFKETTPSRFANNIKMGLSIENYFWITGDYLYITNEDTKAANLFIYSTEDIPNDLLYPSDCDCKTKPHISNICVNPLDKPFYFPGDRVDDVKKIVYDKLMRVYFNTATDKTTDNKDETSK